MLKVNHGSWEYSDLIYFKKENHFANMNTIYFNTKLCHKNDPTVYSFDGEQWVNELNYIHIEINHHICVHFFKHLKFGRIIRSLITGINLSDRKIGSSYLQVLIPRKPELLACSRLQQRSLPHCVLHWCHFLPHLRNIGTYLWRRKDYSLL